VRSLADIPQGDGERYYYSGFIGGGVDGMREILEGVVHATETDFANGVNPKPQTLNPKSGDETPGCHPRKSIDGFASGSAKITT